jgi:hypothetical protein
MYRILLRNPRISRQQLTRIFKVNPKTVDIWWKAALEKRIIIPPVFRRKSFSNFREYYYFLTVKDPHELYESLQIEEIPVTYFSVHTGFCNFQIISREPIDPPGELVMHGPRSDFHVTTPPHCTFEEGVARIEEVLQNADNIEERESPLQYHDEPYEPWDETDEAIFWEICNDVRISFTSVVRKLGTYNDKTWSWFRNRNFFGQTITMFFPLGESSYQLSLYAITTEHDSLLIDIFSHLPTTTLFYRMDEKVMMGVYLPFTLKGRYIVRKAMSVLQKKELVDGYTNSNVEYGFRH